VIQGFNSLSEGDIRKLFEDDEEQPICIHGGEVTESKSGGWLSWLAKKLNLATKDELMNETEAREKLAADYAANKAAVAGALGALKTQITELKTQLAENPNSTEALLALATQIEQDTADLQASQTPLPPVDNPTTVEGD